MSKITETFLGLFKAHRKGCIVALIVAVLCLGGACSSDKPADNAAQNGSVAISTQAESSGEGANASAGDPDAEDPLDPDEDELVDADGNALDVEGSGSDGDAGAGEADGANGSGDASGAIGAGGGTAAGAAANSNSAGASKGVPKSLGSGWVAQSGGLYYTNDADPEFSAYKSNKGKSFEDYSRLDFLGRCGPATACIGLDIMPTGGRGDISQVKPSGWRQAHYDFINGGVLYNRCHLIAFSLAGENANERNLITGTRQMNEAMIMFESIVSTYVTATGNHVLYRVTPVFSGNELVARGVHMEALSVEDHGAKVKYNVYLPNKQDGVKVNYATGESSLSGSGKSGSGKTSSGKTGSGKTGSAANSSNKTGSQSTAKSSSGKSGKAGSTTGKSTSSNSQSYVLNTSSRKFHYPSCSAVSKMSERNKATSNKSRDEIIAQGYSSCGICYP